MKNSQSDKIRESLGLPSRNPGMTTCLMCEKEFYSWDKKNNRRCPSCVKELRKIKDNEDIDELYWDWDNIDAIEITDDMIDFLIDYNNEIHRDIKQYK